MAKIVLFSFFSGVGMLDLAFENNNYEVVFVNEYERNFLESYSYIRRNSNVRDPFYGYINRSASDFLQKDETKNLFQMVLNEKKKGNMVGFVGGPPCPDFSVGGKNRGVDGENGVLTNTYFSLIKECKPDFFLFENVKGLIKTEKHKVFYLKMRELMTKSGYAISDRLLNSLSYGVPQHRERILMVGILENELKSIHKFGITKEGIFNFPWEKYQKYEPADILSMDWPSQDSFIENSKREFNYKVPIQLTVNYWFDKNKISEHPNGLDQFKVRTGITKMSAIAEGDVRRKSFKRLHRWRYSPTAAYGNNEVHLHPYLKRRLSVAEAMAIQSLPKDFYLPDSISLTKKFKMIGNGVPYLMAESIAKTLYEIVSEIEKVKEDKYG
ncbi:DNA cytosine methyltransferase [Candidatus Enterococcus murrayae]|uniref:DNA (cytosine-5-)-methyltransferase n=1 Tax=Candidatus Enterococcus murrayae TaxID=2815321 RepID=A0ABS3HCZ9_9ENTE|nr:DNA cytosine methyltransferase [Enterococcus sp. MJM16]MBO0451333.1 DNA cytosine methyltransferase [Enterococcus sp. MJM16]